MEQGLVQALIGSGPIGIFALYFYLQTKADRDALRQERADRLIFDKDRLETDKKIAAALTVLAFKITGSIPDDRAL
ncbi:hypothetical protein K9B35_14225 [Sphingomonas sp. R647]|uniref:hypothetical protein n=1 Tax=Sphingomonas sp. R647 TaxID=2875233 RepID=UPI001CD7D050|nr:hypothetical protein [Sphingomonas sp. R647]MCA1199130.1 hypothetical protein [Sphingomonas sp. R647]